jgi:hypothetical protein
MYILFNMIFNLVVMCILFIIGVGSIFLGAYIIEQILKSWKNK